MRLAANRHGAGFTLIEVLISLAIFMMVMLGIYQVFDSSFRTYNSGTRRLDAQQSARGAMDEMVRRLRMVGYFPENFTVPPASPLLTNRIQIGTDTALAVRGDLEGSGASQVYLFCLSGTNILRVRGAAGVAATYVCNGTDIIAENITSLRFTYFDATNTQVTMTAVGAVNTLDGQVTGGVPTFGTTTARQGVRTILVNLTARETVPGQAPQVYTLTSTVALRNTNN
jgi:prepilin-type N-terminal cleavage/methylation domain-containing protein